MTSPSKFGSLTNEQIDFYNEQGYLVLPNLLSEQDLAPAKEAMNKKVSMIADELMHAGLISDKLEHRPFKYRLAELFADLTSEEFLNYGRSWRDRLPGYFDLMSNPKILDAVESLIGGELFPIRSTTQDPKFRKLLLEQCLGIKINHIGPMPILILS